MPFFRASIFGAKAFKKNGPTDPEFIIADERDFSIERQKLVALIGPFADRGRAHAAK